MSVLLSASRLSTFQTCARKYYFTYVRQIVPAGRQVALEFGAAWGKAMDVWHRGGTVDHAMAAFDAAYPRPAEERIRTPQTAKHLLQLYAERWPRPELFTVHSAETWLEAPIGNGVQWRGRVDKLVGEDGDTFPLEHKTTTSYLTGRTLLRYAPNVQAVGYAFLSQHAGGAARLVLDLVHVSATEPKQGERFLRWEIRAEPWMLTEFQRLVGQEAARIQQTQQAQAEGEDAGIPPEDVWTPNWNACTQYGECPYRRLCVAAPSVRERLIAEQYVARPPQEETRNGPERED